MMRAAVQDGYGPVDALAVRQVERPRPGRGRPGGGRREAEEGEAGDDVSARGHGHAADP